MRLAGLVGEARRGVHAGEHWFRLMGLNLLQNSEGYCTLTFRSGRRILIM
eukprot:TsM_000384500 transcript=TsM_000384500 gene=TsM_000384500